MKDYKIDLNYPIIQACGPKYSEKIKDIFEVFGSKNSFCFHFGRDKKTNTIYFRRENDKRIHAGTIMDISPELRNLVILAEDF